MRNIRRMTSAWENTGDRLMCSLYILSPLLVVFICCEAEPPAELSQQVITVSADKSLSLPEDIDEEDVVRDDRLFKLKHKRTISLPLNKNTPILGEITGRNSIAISDSSIFLLDKGQAYQFDMDGTYLQPIGSLGKGPGEYITPMTMAVTPSGRILIYDGSTLRVNRYDKNGRFVDMHLINNLSRVLFDSAGNRLQLSYSWISSDKAVILAKQDRDTQRWLYEINLSNTYTFEAFGPYMEKVGLCYSSALESIFYLEPWSYKIKEIDARSGEVKRQFGIEPPDYVGIKKENLMALSRRDNRFHRTLMEEYTLLEEIHLIADTYLLLRFKPPLPKNDGSRQFDSWASFIAYDISAKEIKAFTVDKESMQGWIRVFLERSEDSFSANVDWPSRTAVKGPFLFTYKEPQNKDLDNSNGMIEVFSAFVKEK